MEEIMKEYHVEEILRKYNFKQKRNYVYVNSELKVIAYVGGVYRNNPHDAKWGCTLYYIGKKEDICTTYSEKVLISALDEIERNSVIEQVI